MSYQQVRDILEQIRDVHRRLRDKLEGIRPDAEDERTRFILESARRDEQIMNLALAQFEHDSGSTALRAWIQYVPDEDTQRLLDETRFTPDMEPGEVLQRTARIDESLVELYQRLSEQVSAPGVREIFDRLAEQTNQRLADASWQIRDSESAPAGRPGPTTSDGRKTRHVENATDSE